MAPQLLPLLGFLLSLSLPSTLAVSSSNSKDGTTRVCIIGAGIAGSSVSHFLKEYSNGAVADVLVLEKRGKIGGRMATVTLAGDIFEAGATILHPKNLHFHNFTSILRLKPKVKPGAVNSSSSSSSSSSWLGIWDGSRFVFKTLPPLPDSSSALYRKIHSLVNSFLIFRRYGLSLLRMNRFVKKAVDGFTMYYEGLESRPVFETVEEMLKWTGLYGLTQRTLQEELVDVGISQRLISELVTLITRINYGQNVSISGLAGAVSLAGSEAGLWSVYGGNWQIAAGLIKKSNATLHLQEEVTSISYAGGYYELNSKSGNNYSCRVTVIATPLDELNIKFSPPVFIPSRKLQHTYTTFVRGLLNPAYFGLSSVSEVPDLVGTLEVPDVPFSSISVLKKYSEDDKTYKIFSRAPLEDNLLDLIFSTRKETVKINWPAYPHYEAPEIFAPFLLDGQHLYYINSFENAASTMETSAVAAENVARLILSKLGLSSGSPDVRSIISDQESLHVDL